MKPARPKRNRVSRPTGNTRELRRRLAEAEATLQAIRTGEVDAVVVAGRTGPRVFTLEGADHPYRTLIESMHEGALTLAEDGTILYCNLCFAHLMKCPLEQVIGCSFYRFLSTRDHAEIRPHFQNPEKSGTKLQMLLNGAKGFHTPVQIAIRPLGRTPASRASICLVVTDMTEAHRTEERLRALTNRVVEVQEAECGRMAVELHDNVTQLLCAVLVRSAALASSLPATDMPTKLEAIRLRELLGQTVGQAERISSNLRPSVLVQLGLVAILQEACAKFTEQTGVPVKLACANLAQRLPAGTELALYRIFDKALQNVTAHAKARHVKVRLTTQGAFAKLSITDDGIGFNPDGAQVRRRIKGGLGLMSMRERANYVGGAVDIRSAKGAGTRIEIRVPLAADAANPKWSRGRPRTRTRP